MTGMALCSRRRELCPMTTLNVFRDADLEALLELNALRAGGASARLLQLEEQFSERFAPQHRLAAYGSLAPKRSNHHQLQDLRGEWHSGCAVRGDLADR